MLVCMRWPMLSSDVFLGESDHPVYQFKKKLSAFARTARPVFYSVRRGNYHVVDSYAGTNFDEFWAVWIEHLFEDSQALRVGSRLI